MRNIQLQSTFLVVALASLAFGCSSSAFAAPDAGADVDTDADTDADTDSEDALACAAMLATPCDEVDDTPQPYALLLEAASFGADLQFVRASRSPAAILSARETDDGMDVPLILVLAPETGDHVAAELLEPPEVALGLRPVDVSSPPSLRYGSDGLTPGLSVLGYAAIALLCGESTCFLYGLAVDGDQQPLGLEAIPGGEVPLPESRAVVGVPADGIWESALELCVAGDGIACFDGDAWTIGLAPGGGALNSISAEIDTDAIPPRLFAAGNGGRILVREGGAWSEIDSGTSASLVTVAARDGTWAAGGEGVIAFGDGEHDTACATGSAYTATRVFDGHSSSQGNISALAEDQDLEILLSNDGFSGCVRGAELDGVPRNADDFGDCGGGEALCSYALTPRAMYLRPEEFLL